MCSSNIDIYLHEIEPHILSICHIYKSLVGENQYIQKRLQNLFEGE